MKTKKFMGILASLAILVAVFGLSRQVGASPVIESPASGGGGCPQYTAMYYTNMSLTGSAALTQCESERINYDWGTGSPAQGIGADFFSVRWTRNVYIRKGSYTFRVVTDDGIRLWLDGNLIIDKWFDQSATSYNVNRNFTFSKTHSIVVEYFENTGDAVVQFWWTRN